MEPRKANKFIWLIIILLVVGIGFQLVNYQLSRVKVVLYGTSTDSVTIQVENILKDLQAKFGPRMAIEINIVARLTEAGDLVSLQTDNEEIAAFDLEENTRQAVIAKYYPDKLLDYLQVKNTDVFNINWRYFAEFANIDADKVAEKVSSEGESLLKAKTESFETIRQELPTDVNTLPLLYINDQLYQGTVDHFSLSAAIVKPVLRSWRDNLPADSKFNLFGNSLSFKSWTKFQHNGISECYNNLDCNDKSDKNGVCQDVGSDVARCVYSAPAEVALTILNDEDCATCSTDLTVSNLQNDFKGLVSSQLDISSKEGDQLKTDIGVSALPVYLFDDSIEQAANFSAYAQLGYLGQISENEDYKYALVQGGIPGVLLDRDILTNQLDIYVMSHCPYALALENSLIALKKDINFDLDIHYVLQNEVNEEGVASLLMSSQNGEAELAENKRQLVIQKYYPEQFLSYLELRNEDIASADWQAVATEAGIDAADVQTKVTAEGNDLLSTDAQLALDLGINSAPAYLWQNRYFGFGLSNLIKFEKFSDLEIGSQDIGFCLNSQEE